MGVQKVITPGLLLNKEHTRLKAHRHAPRICSRDRVINGIRLSVLIAQHATPYSNFSSLNPSEGFKLALSQASSCSIRKVHAKPWPLQG